MDIIEQGDGSVEPLLLNLFIKLYEDGEEDQDEDLQQDDDWDMQGSPPRPGSNISQHCSYLPDLSPTVYSYSCPKYHHILPTEIAG